MSIDQPHVLRGLARNPMVGDEVLRSLLRSEDEETLYALAGRPDLPDDLAEALARHPRDGVRVRLARNFAAAMRVWRLLAADPVTRRALASHYTGITEMPGEELGRVEPPLPEEVGRALAGSEDPGVRLALAHRDHNTDEVYRMLATDPSTPVRRALSRRWKHPPPEVVRDWLTDPAVVGDAVYHHEPPADLVPMLLAHEHPQFRAAAATNATLDLPTALACAGSPDRDVRDGVARNATAPLAAVLPLAEDPDPTVRATLMFRPDLPEPVRERISRGVPPPPEYRVAEWLLPGVAPLDTRLAHLDSPVPFVRRAVARSTDLPPDAVARLLADPDPSVRQVVAEHHPDTPPDLLVELARRSFPAKLTLSRHPNFPADEIVAYANSGNESDRIVAAEHPRVPDDAAAGLARAASASVRRALAANPACPPGYVVALLSDADEYVARDAAANPALPLSVARDVVHAAGLSDG